MKILFSMRHPGALRNFGSTVRELARRGHQIHLSFMMQGGRANRYLPSDLAQPERVTHAEVTVRTNRAWSGLARGVRAWSDYLRYLEPEYRRAQKLRERATRRVPAALVAMSGWPGIETRAGRRALATLLLWLERALPTDPALDAEIETQEPDVVLVTPLVDLGSDQVEYLRSARRQRVRTGLCVHSWDNLTNKGRIRIQPDRIYLWNERQKREAVEMHGVPAEHVVVTGAPVYDQWFGRRPSTTREKFCAKAGLPSDRPFLLYLCSSAFIAPQEAAFVQRWVQTLRAASVERVREAAVLVRPHPVNRQPWNATALGPHVSVWPTAGTDPIDDASRNDFYDSLYYCAAAIGVNTSAQIEAGIIGRPVFTVQSEQHAATQEGTLHFHHLLEAGGGLLHHAADLDQHLGQLAQGLTGCPEHAAKLRGFVQTFVRPHGLDVPATPLIADAIEELGRLSRPAPEPRGLRLRLLRAVLSPLVSAQHGTANLFRIVRKRVQQLNAPAVSGWLLGPLFRTSTLALRWRPARRFIQTHVAPRVIPRLNPDHPTEAMIAVPRLIDKLHRSNRPLIIGPWLQEVGLEVLYWRPFLRWITTCRQFDPERVIVVSRGGVASWYKDIGAKYVDVFDFFTPAQVTPLPSASADGPTAASALTALDRDIVKLVKQTFEQRDADLLHPMHMYRLFDPYWQGRRSIDLVESHASFERLPTIDAADVVGALPDDYVAVRFYHNGPFPPTEDNRNFVHRLLGQLTETTEVVLLNPGFALDGHRDLNPEVRRRVHRIGHLLAPRTNLAVQSTVISRARAYVGNYGGLAFLAPFCGSRTLAFFSSPAHVAAHHLELMSRAAAKLQRGSFVALDVEALDPLSLILSDHPAASTDSHVAAASEPAHVRNGAR